MSRRARSQRRHGTAALDRFLIIYMEMCFVDSLFFFVALRRMMVKDIVHFCLHHQRFFPQKQKRRKKKLVRFHLRGALPFGISQTTAEQPFPAHGAVKLCEFCLFF